MQHGAKSAVCIDRRPFARGDRMEDKMIVDLYWARDEMAIEQTRLKYGNYLMTIAFNVLMDRQDAEESVNDTYLKAWNSMPDNRPDLLSAYLAKIVRRDAIDIYRRKNSAKRAGGQYAVCLDELAECVAAEIQCRSRAKQEKWQN